MKTLWIFAHPEARSFNGALRDEGIQWLQDAGHEVMQSDLYAMGWKAVADGDDFIDHDPSDRLFYGADSEAHYYAGTLAADVQAEHDKLAWADNVIFQFPLWWYSTPAILTGWFDRVLTKGFAYGVSDPNNPGRSQRYGDGPMAGKHGMVLVTVGGRVTAFGTRGINGHIDDILFPIQHGTLWYTGMTVLPPFVTYAANRVDEAEFQTSVNQLTDRLAGLTHDAPVPYRYQNTGDYDDDMVLKDNLMPGQHGLGIHLESPLDDRREPVNAAFSIRHG